jgi:hypothetical protein
VRHTSYFPPTIVQPYLPTSYFPPTISHLYLHIDSHVPPYLPTYMYVLVFLYHPTSYKLTHLSPTYHSKSLLTSYPLTYLATYLLWTTSYLLTYPFTYQTSCNLPIKYLIFLLTYIINEMKYNKRSKKLDKFCEF